MGRSAGVGVRVRRYAAVVLLAAVVPVLVPAAPAPAAAPPGCPTADVRAYAKAARSVFVGTVDSVAVRDNLAKNPDDRIFIFTHQVTVSRVYKGAAELEVSTGGTPSDQVEVLTLRSANRCSLGRLAPGQDYVFFTHDEQGVVIASFDSGTAPATSTLVGDVEGLLGAGKDPTPPPPATATFTRVADSDPATLTRLFAPGAALVIVGLLGLAVVGRLGRRG